MTPQLTVRLLVLTTVLGVAGVAQAKQPKRWKYVGGHPLHDRGYCYIEAPHVHAYAPARGNQRRIKLEYRVYDDHYHFVGDPVARGYDGDTSTYYGHHPIALDAVAGADVEGAPHIVVYCYLDGPHFHAYAPPADLTFEVKGGAHWYVGAYPPAYESDKVALVKINPLYAKVEYARPVVEVEPPAAYVGPIVDVHAPVIAVEAPVGHGEIRGGLEVDVHIPTPTLSLEVGLPGVVVVDEHHDHGRRVRGRHGHGKHEKRSHKRKKSKRSVERIWRSR